MTFFHFRCITWSLLFGLFLFYFVINFKLWQSLPQLIPLLLTLLFSANKQLFFLFWCIPLCFRMSQTNENTQSDTKPQCRITQSHAFQFAWTIVWHFFGNNFKTQAHIWKWNYPVSEMLLHLATYWNNKHASYLWAKISKIWCTYKR